MQTVNLTTPNGYKLYYLKYNISNIHRWSRKNRPIHSKIWILRIEGYYICEGTQKYCERFLNDVVSGKRFLKKKTYHLLEDIVRNQ